jgi:Winged helix-turn-helix DNA-binding
LVEEIAPDTSRTNGGENMGWFTDLFKDVPLSAELREKLATIEAENDTLKTDNVILKDDLREAKGEIIRLQRRLDQFTHHPELDDTDLKILKEIALTSDPAASYLAEKLNMELGVVEFRLQRLTEIDYLSTWSIGGQERYSLEPKSREYLIRHNLIS